MTHQTKRNHYVPRGYLKGWAGDDKRLWVYRLVVSNPAVPPWRRRSIRGVAWHQHLYTELAAGGETDDVERWLDREFETPAQEALDRIRSGQRLAASHWRTLVRFVAAQYVRTPARFLEMMARWGTDLQPLVDETLRSSVAKLAEMRSGGLPLPRPAPTESDPLPSRITIRRSPGGGGELSLELVAGRGLWMFAIRHLLTGTLRALEKHRWTILEAPDGVEWVTSDDPVIPLNYYGDGRYDFKGGWGSKNTEILMPLSPRHLLYTRVGIRQRPNRKVNQELAVQFQRFTVEHAHRAVFAARPVPGVEKIRPRLVDRQRCEAEAQAWERWHREQSRAETEIKHGD